MRHPRPPQLCLRTNVFPRKENDLIFLFCKAKLTVSCNMKAWLYLENLGSLQEDLSGKVLHNDVTEQFTCGLYQVGVGGLQRAVQYTEMYL